MVTPELIGYIRASFAAGVLEEQIAEALRSAGWEESDLKAGLATVKSAPEASADIAPVSPVSFSMRSAQATRAAEHTPAHERPPRKRRGMLSFVLASLAVILFAGVGLAFAHMKNVLPFGLWPFGANENAKELFDNVAARAFEIQSASYALTLSVESQPLAAGIKPFYIPEPPDKENTEDARSREALNGLGQSLNFLPAEFRAAVTLSGAAQKSSSDAGDSRIELNGEVQLGDSSYAANFEFITKGEVAYARINKFPGEFGFSANISALKGRWVKITPEDMVNRYNEYGLPVGMEQQGKLRDSSAKAFELLRHALKIAREEEFVSYIGEPSREKVGVTDTLRYTLALDPERAAFVFRRLQEELGKEYEAQSDASLIEKGAKKAGEFLEGDPFKDFLSYLNAISLYELWIDRQTGFPTKISFAASLAPSETPLVKTKNTQLSLRAAYEVKDINNPIAIEEPGDSITFGEAEAIISGKTAEELERERRDARRIAGVRKLQTLLQLYFEKCDAYPGDAFCSCANSPKTYGELATVIAGPEDAAPSNTFANPPEESQYLYSPQSQCSGYLLGVALESSGSAVLGTDADGKNLGINKISCADPVYCVEF